MGGPRPAPGRFAIALAMCNRSIFDRIQRPEGPFSRACDYSNIGAAQVAMIKFECIVQEGTVPEVLRPRLAAELVRISTSLLGGSPDDVEVEFNEIPRGFGFRGGKPSTTSIIGARIPEGSEQQKRAQMLREIGVMWCEIVGCSTDEFAAWARDQNYPV